MIQTLIIDDEMSARTVVKNYLDRYGTSFVVAGEADGVESGLRLIEDCKPDLVFLDVRMQDGTGFDLLCRLKEVWQQWNPFQISEEGWDQCEDEQDCQVLLKSPSETGRVYWTDFRKWKSVVIWEGEYWSLLLWEMCYTAGQPGIQCQKDCILSNDWLDERQSK